LKNALYSKYEHIDGDPSEDSDKKGMKHIVPIACDSRGGLGDEALQFIRRVYARSSPDGPARQWPSESMRTNLRNKLLDELSCLLARHRALDYIFMGVPDENRDNGFQPSPDSSLAHKKRKGHNKQNKTKQNKTNNVPPVHRTDGIPNGSTRVNNSDNHVNNSSSSSSVHVYNSSSSIGSSSFNNTPALVSPRLLCNLVT